MKLTFFILVICILSFAACKLKQKSVPSNPSIEQSSARPKTSGKVSHQYRATGCATVIIVGDAENSLILIPKDKLPIDMDIDGLSILFNYRTLKIKQPAGCSDGIPAELRDITKK